MALSREMLATTVGNLMIQVLEQQAVIEQLTGALQEQTEKAEQAKPRAAKRPAKPA